jgi:hypothetical protein
MGALSCDSRNVGNQMLSPETPIVRSLALLSNNVKSARAKKPNLRRRSRANRREIPIETHRAMSQDFFRNAAPRGKSVRSLVVRTAAVVVAQLQALTIARLAPGTEFQLRVEPGENITKTAREAFVARSERSRQRHASTRNNTLRWP